MKREGKKSGGPLVVRAGRGASLAVALLALAAGLVVSGCSKPGREQAATARHERSQKLIDSGNEAYRIGDYRQAARRYAAAAVVSPDDPAAYYGMGMALSKLGRDEEARSAYARARELARTKPVLEGQGTRINNAPAETIPDRHP